MGKQKRHFKGNNKSKDKQRRQQKEADWRSKRGDDNYQVSVPENVRMEAFYKALRIVGDDEWHQFLASLREPLPACFRLNPDYVFVNELQNQLLAFAGTQIDTQNVTINPVKQLPWYPNGYGYQFGTDRRSIRKLDVLKNLHKWLVQHTENGNITRQEAVSMVPPIALDVQPHHKCLDMCAAPGSKTSQLLEVVNRSMASPEDQQGLVIANDSDTDRAYMLVHQCKRINSPLLVVTTHKGQLFPPLYPAPITSSISEARNATKPIKDGYFDRVLCDVPCSGDGTLRKNPCIWRKWSTSTGMTLHPLQLQIATRGVQLLKWGGLMVYSTCSMSPYENEAVVAELLRQARGTLELVDARQFLPLFKARPGLSCWPVLDDYLSIKQSRHDGHVKRRRDGMSNPVDVKQENTETTASGGFSDQAAIDSQSAPVSDNPSTSELAAEPHTSEVKTAHPDPCLEECVKLGMTIYPTFASVPHELSRKIRESMFPPTEEERDWMHLDRCLRCVPHDEDTGGFFVATLRKVQATPKDIIPIDLSTGPQDPLSSGSAIDVILGIDSDGKVDSEVDMAEANEEAVVVEVVSGLDGEADAEMNGDDADRDDDAADEEDVDLLKPVLTKRGREETADDTNAAAEAEVNFDGAGHNQRQNQRSHKGLVDFKPWDIEAFEKVKRFYGFSDVLTVDSFMVREDVCVNIPSGVSAKAIFWMPVSVRRLISADRDGRLKLVCAGIKVLEKKVNKFNDNVEFRLIQEGVSVLLPYITARKIEVTIQDFSNLLEGGLVSFSTLSAATVQTLASMPPGGVIAVYNYSPSDINTTGSSSALTSSDAEVVPNNIDPAKPSTLTAHTLYAICWRGASRTLNVMCGKTEIESMKHQLTALGVFRPKISVKQMAVGAVEQAVAAAVAQAAALENGEDTSNNHPSNEVDTNGKASILIAPDI